MGYETMGMIAADQQKAAALAASPLLAGGAGEFGITTGRAG